MSQIINHQFQIYRTKIDEIVKDLHQLTIEINHKELAAIISDLRNRLNDPFMFVVVGEVKSGKSSFVNALLDTGKEICKAAPQPMTDTIQQIVYGDQEETITINQYLKKVFEPVEILKEIAIVDTPGTNTIVKHHQEITERFIPASDLIVFVFEAKNPYRESAWQFFDYINDEWRKKIIFILQQKDLLNEADLEINRKGVYDYALKKGIENPLVFSVSAKQEMENNKEISGFTALRNFIKEKITGGKAPFLKLQNNIQTISNINSRILNGLEIRKKQWDVDLEFRKDITDTLNNQQNISNRQIDILVENLLAGYDNVTRKKEQELRTGLSFFSLLKRSISSIFNKNSSAQNWLDNLSGSLKIELNNVMNLKLNEGIASLAESIQQMAYLIDLKIRNSKTILKDDDELFSSIAEKRNNVIKELHETFKEFIKKSENFSGDDLFPDKHTISPNIMTGSGIAVIGAILTAVANGAVFDITGGVLTTVGLLFAGVASTRKKRKIIKGYKNEIAKGHEKLKNEVTEKLTAYVTNIKSKIDNNFSKFDRMLENEKTQIDTLFQKHRNISERIEEIVADEFE